MAIRVTNKSALETSKRVAIGVAIPLVLLMYLN